MSYVSTIRARFKPESVDEVERLFNERFVPLRRQLKEQGDLQSMVLIRSASEPGAYELVSHWASKEAHDRNEQSAPEEAVLVALAGHVAGPLDEFAGSIVAEVR